MTFQPLRAITLSILLVLPACASRSLCEAEANGISYCLGDVSRGGPCGNCDCEASFGGTPVKYAAGDDHTCQTEGYTVQCPYTFWANPDGSLSGVLVKSQDDCDTLLAGPQIPYGGY